MASAVAGGGGGGYIRSMPNRFFNVAGPCNPVDHYMLPTARRLQGIDELVRQKLFFVIHAARQSGKTTLAQELVRTLTAGTTYHAVYCSLESVQGVEDAEKGIPAVIDCLRSATQYPQAFAKTKFAPPGADLGGFNVQIKNALTAFCQALDKPLVVFFDEADCLSGQTLINFLRQLRDGYVNRSTIPFVHSLCLIGMRDIRDYKAQVRNGRTSLGSASPFNIVTESLTLGSFTRDELAELYGQHTADTGQVFAPEAVAKAFDLTQGQPWLVNALAREVTVKILGGDLSRRIEPEMIEQAAQTIILRRDTHIDSLLERLKEERVRKIVEPMMLGKEWGFSALDDDFQYAKDLGLIRTDGTEVRPANPMYGEVIARTLSLDAQNSLGADRYHIDPPRYLRSDGSLDMNLLLGEFQAFWRENSEIWTERFFYREAAPHLVLMAFLQRVVNGGGRVLREMATGRMRLDLCAEFNGYRYPVEVKLDYGLKTIPEGLAQLGAYMDKLGCGAGWLVIFDRDPAKPWDAKVFRREATSPAGKPITIFGC